MHSQMILMVLDYALNSRILGLSSLGLFLLILVYLFLVILGFELMRLHLLDRHSTIEPCLQSFLF
jgi:hypothetical protein